MSSSGADRVAIALQRVSKSFGSVHAVNDVSLSINEGEIVALLGPNGAGKTTTIDMILGLARPDRGTVSLFSTTPAAAVHAGHVGGMLQTGTPPLYLNVRELITMTASLYPHPLDVDEVLKTTGTTEIASRSTTKLSGGQTQRVRFAVALVADPDLLVLDEPTAAIDVEGRRDFWNIMRSVAASGKTVLFATHYLEEADTYADRVILMARGRIVADGPPTEIKARVGGRVIRATLGAVATTELMTIEGVTKAERQGDGVKLSCPDSETSDRVLRAFLTRYPDARDLEVRSVGLEEAFLTLTSEGADHVTTADDLGVDQDRLES
ncbi:MAG: ABC transporter ATP-binding protein [Acidimicrobiales bacterium]